MEGLFVLIAIFNYTFGVIISYLFKGNQSLILRVIAVGALIFSIAEYQSSLKIGLNKIKGKFSRILVFSMFIYVWMFVTYLSHGTLPDIMKTYLLSYPTKIISTVFLSFAVIRKNLISKINKWINIYAIFYTVVLFYCVQSNETGFSRSLDIDRQTLSYAGAYACLMLLYVNMNFNNIDKPHFLSAKIVIPINYALMLMNIYIILAGGGRGAFILIIFGAAYFIFKNTSSFDFKHLATMISLVVVAIIAINYFATSKQSASGFSSIQALFTEGFTDQSSQDRVELYTIAWYYIKQALFLGNGAGSTAYTVGFYTHNIFMDVLLEYGIWGLIILLIFLLQFFSKCKKLRRIDVSNPQMDFCVTVFISSFVLLLFSGTMYSEGAIWFAMLSVYFINEDCYKTNI